MSWEVQSRESPSDATTCLILLRPSDALESVPSAAAGGYFLFYYFLSGVFLQFHCELYCLFVYSINEVQQKQRIKYSLTSCRSATFGVDHNWRAIAGGGRVM